MPFPLPSRFPALALAALAVLLTTPDSVSADWVEIQTIDMFQVRSEFPLSDAQGRRLQQELRQLRRDIEQMLGVRIAQEPVEINLFASRRSYRKFLALRVPEGVSRPALYVKGTDMARVYVYRRLGFETDLRHECTHAVLHTAFPYVPLWLDEGFAEYFEVPARDRASKNPHLGSIRRALWFGWRPNLAKLERHHDLSEMTGTDYRDSWAWVHYFLHGPAEVRQVMSNYLYDIRVGEPAGRLSDRLAADLPEARKGLIKHFRSWD